MSEAEHRTIRVVTWNIHGFKGEGRRPDPERTVRIIRALEPDILALQEVDGRVQFGRLPDAFGRLRAALGGHRAEARLLGEPGHEYGHLLWSRWPIAHAKVRLLPGPGFEPRAAIDATIETPAGPLRVLAVHFGLRVTARRRQADDLAHLVRPGEPTIALGDFNEWRASGGVHRRLVSALPVSACPRTWPSGRPIAAMDRIYASAGSQLRDVRADADGGRGSDHRPLVADLLLLGD